MPDIILVSGGFDPIHSGHIKLINEANKYGDVVVLLNSDEWLRNKKGKEFLSFDERKIIMQNIKGVVGVLIIFLSSKERNSFPFLFRNHSSEFSKTTTSPYLLASLINLI